MQEISAGVDGGQEVRRDARLQLATISEAIRVTGQSPLVEVGAPGARAGNAPPARARAGAMEVPEPAPQPSAPSLAERVAQQLPGLQAAAGGQELGDLFEYRIADPVTIRRNQSALVPILRAEVAAEKVALWSRGAASGRPLRALWLTNASDLSLDGGSFTVLEDGAFASEGLVESMEPGERRLLSYGTDGALLVDGKVEGERGGVIRYTIERGAFIYERERQESRTYTIRNEDAEERTVIVEHPSRPGWEITSAALPEETAPGVYRFRVVVPAQETATLTVAESQPVVTRIALSDVTDDHIAMLIQQGLRREDLEPILRPILDKKAEIVAVQREIQTRTAETARIEGDQNRVRENIRALGSSNEERALVQRYVQQLDRQEDRLQELRAELDQRNARLETLQSELQQLIATASM